MTSRYIRIVSPTEPSGVAWLLNCLLELNVCIFRASRSETWHRGGQGERLTDSNRSLQSWLPSLDADREYRFRDSIEAEWTHEWPQRGARKADLTILFVRDSRDAMYSLWRRDGAALELEEFVRYPDQVSGLDRLRKHCLHLALWLECHPSVVRFEDYKRDDRGTLAKICEDIGLEVTPEDLDRAARSSTFEQAKRAEEAYRARYGADLPVINRSGAVGGWREQPELRTQVESWTSLCSLVGPRLGYQYEGTSTETTGTLLGLAIQSHEFRRTVDNFDIKPQTTGLPTHPAEIFLEQLTHDQLSRSGLPDDEIARILSTAATVASARGRIRATRFAIAGVPRFRKFLSSGLRKHLLVRFTLESDVATRLSTALKARRNPTHR